MSGLSPEALASLGGLNLQDVKADLRFSPAEKKKPLTVELDWMEKNSLQYWNFDSVLEKLNALGTKPAVQESVVSPKAEEEIPNFWKGLAREDEGPDWLMSPFPAAEEAPLSQRQEWNELPWAQQENDLFRWSDQFKRGEPIEDWQLQAVKDNRIYLGDAEASFSPQAEELTPQEVWMMLPEDQRERDLTKWKLKKYLKEPLENWQEEEIGGQEDEEEEATEVEEDGQAESETAAKNGLARWIDGIDWKKAAVGGVQSGLSMFIGLGLGELLHMGPAVEGGLASSVLLVNRLINVAGGSEEVQRRIDQRKKKYPRFYKSLIGKSMETGFNVVKIATAAAARKEVGFIAFGLLAHSAIELMSGHESIISQDKAVGQVADTNPLADSSRAVPGGHETDAYPQVNKGDFAGQSPDAQDLNRQAADNAAQLEKARAEAQLQAAEIERNRQAMEELLRQQQQAAAEAAKVSAQQAAEAARIAALSQGQTVAELAKTMPQQTVSEAVHQIVGNVPHSLEITNAIDRAAGDDVLKLHEGAIRELAKALSDIFTKADAAAAGMGVPYDKGGLQAAEQAYGPNSPVVHAIRTANLENQMESAGIVREFLRPILSGLGAK